MADGPPEDQVVAPLPLPAHTVDVSDISMRLDEEGLLTDLPDVYAGLVLDTERMVLLVKYDRGAADSQVEAFLDRLARVPGTDDISILADPVLFNEAEMAGFALEIATDSGEWANRLGLAVITGASVDSRSGQVVVYSSDDVRSSSVVVDAIPIRIHGSEEGPEEQSRYDDSAPWPGGTNIRIDSSLGSADCTMGFTWRKGGSNELMGSTAEHCYEGTGVSTWYNQGTVVGTRYHTSYVRDTFLFRSSPRSRFNPNVWVGSPTTTDLRWVVGAQPTPVIGGAVALSGANSGLHAGTNLENNHFTPSGKGPMTITSVTECVGGDSGGPWLTTQVDGVVIAHGQHYGRFVTSHQCLYVPVTPISAALSASIAVH